MKKLFFLLTPLLALLLLGSDSPKQYDDRAKIDGLEGTWLRVAVLVEGKPISFQEGDECTYRQGRLTWVGGGNAWSYTADAARVPARLDQKGKDVMGKPILWKCIYEVQGDTLRIGRLFSGERPEHFDDPNVVIDIYRRMK